MSDIYFANTKSIAVFAPDGPKPQFLVDTPQFKALVVGLEAGGQIPVHPGEAAMYHFLEGEGLMTVDEETFAIKPKSTILSLLLQNTPPKSKNDYLLARIHSSSNYLHQALHKKGG